MVAEVVPTLTRGAGRTIVILALAFALVTAGDLLQWGGTGGRHLWIDAGWTLSGLIATWNCAATALRTTGRDRAVWLLFAAGCASWFLGQIAWDYYEIFAHFPPSPTLADAGFLLFAPICVVGFMVMAAHSAAGKILLFLDTAALACATSVVTLSAFWPDITHSHLSVPAQTTAILYPIVYGTMTLSLLSIPVRRAWMDPTIRLLLLGMGAQVTAFILWTPAVLGATYAEGCALDAIWMAGLLAIAIGAKRFRGFPRVDARRQLFGLVSHLPLAAALVAVIVRRWDVTRPGMGGDVQMLLGWLVAGIVLFTSIRLSLTLRESGVLLRRTHEVMDALRESEERFRTIFHWAPFGIEIADTEGRLIDTNKALQDMLGYSAEELSNIDYALISHPDDVAAEAALDDRLLTGEVDHYQLVKRHVRKDGAAIWTRLTASSMRTNDGMHNFAVGMVEDITERREAEEQLHRLAMHDSLTGLPNRLQLQQRLAEALESARVQGSGCALLLMDLDRFKEINDTFGHPCGDALLREVARRLDRRMRRGDTVSRLGGDEFAVVLPDATAQDAAHVAGGLLHAFDAPFVIDEQTLHVRTSIGIACYPEYSKDGTDLLRQADIAMYEAKRSGAGAAAYSPAQDRETQERALLARALRAAIDENQLLLHFQPKASCRSRTVTGVEALVRWRHAERGLIPPDQFIPLAEHSGLIVPLTYTVMREALHQARAMWDAGWNLRVWINLSARTLHDPELPTMVAGLLRDHDASPEWLGLEVTESAVMEEPDRALEILHRLDAMGIHISIDDFGTGYSSLSYLQRLPVRELKIDRSFILHMAEARGDQSIVRATINLAHELGIEVVAEGVEDATTWNQLAQLHCDSIQGYFLCPPVDGLELENWLASGVAIVSTAPGA